MIKLATLNSMNTPNALAFEPYNFICESQDDDCTIDASQMLVLRHIMSRVPSIHIDDLDGARTRFLSRTEHDAYLFVEIDGDIVNVNSGRYLVTSFIVTLSELREYIDIEPEAPGACDIPSNRSGLAGIGTYGPTYVD